MRAALRRHLPWVLAVAGFFAGPFVTWPLWQWYVDHVDALATRLGWSSEAVAWSFLISLLGLCVAMRARYGS